MKIKVCGMRNSENVSSLLALKPDFIGFIFYDKSKRFVTDFPQVQFPAEIKKVGVFVNEIIEEVIATVEKNKLDFVQLHGDETPDYCENLMRMVTEPFDYAQDKLGRSENITESVISAPLNHQVQIIKAFSVDETFDFDLIQPYENYCEYFLFDTKGKDYGGNGVKFNWEILQKYKGKTPFLLSGGISKEDAVEINKIKHSAFEGIDINSGFEIEPALKNINDIKEFKQNLL